MWLTPWFCLVSVSHFTSPPLPPTRILGWYCWGLFCFVVCSTTHGYISIHSVFIILFCEGRKPWWNESNAIVSFFVMRLKYTAFSVLLITWCVAAVIPWKNWMNPFFYSKSDQHCLLRLFVQHRMWNRYLHALLLSVMVVSCYHYICFFFKFLLILPTKFCVAFITSPSVKFDI